MKKKTLVSAVLAATIMGTASVSLAAENMFSDVPLDHWAYDAVAKLAEDGIIEGYGDTNFGGDKAITRYEMAQLVEKAMQNQENARAVDKAAIEKLQKEFDSELRGEVQDLRKDVDDLKGRMGWYGDARIRYFANKKQEGNNGAYSGERSRFEKRVRLGFWANPGKNLSVDGRLKYEDNSWEKSPWTTGNQNFNSWDNSTNNQNSLRLDKLSLNWENAGTKVSVGRTEVKLGEGLLWWENQVDGAYVKHQFGPNVTAMVGVGDLSAEGWQQSNINAQFGEIAVKTSPATKIALSNMRTLTTAKAYQTSGKNVDVWNGSQWVGNVWLDNANSEWVDSEYKLNQYSLSLNTQLARKWNLITEAVTNNVGTVKNADKHGVWARLTYGKMDWKHAKDWQLYGEYFSLGNTAVDSTYWGHRLNIAGGDGFGGNGTRGFGINLDYMLADNTCLGLNFYKLKPYDEAKAGFTKYNDVATVALSYMF